MSRSQKQYLLDIIAAIEDARSFVDGMTFRDLEDDLRTQYALQRTFEIIGEATKQISMSTRKRYPDVPWRAMAGMRDMLIHQYFAVNLEVVWDTIHTDFNRVEPQLKAIVENLPNDTA